MRNLVVILFCYLLTAACGQPSQFPIQENAGDKMKIAELDEIVAEKPTGDLVIDSVNFTKVILEAFELEMEKPEFLKEIGFKDDGSKFYTGERPFIFGDLDGDGLADALMPFSIEGTGGNNWTGYYAVFVNDDEGKWRFKSTVDRGGSWSGNTIKMVKIKDGKVYGIIVPKDGEPQSDEVIVYTYQNGWLMDSSQ